MILIVLSSCTLQKNNRAYEEVGLVKGSVIWEDLKIAVPCLVLGVLLVYIRLILDSKNKKGFTYFIMGILSILGVILILVALYHLIFLWAWIEYIIMYAILFFIVLGVIISLFKKN